MMNHPYNFNKQAIDADSMLSLDDDISMMNIFAVPSSTDTATEQPVTIGITQISPNGPNDEMDRYLLAPTPPLVITQHEMKLMSFLSPTQVEPVSDCDAPLSFTTIAASFQNEHRHVTPMPLGTFSPVSSLNMSSDSQKGLHTTGDSTNAIADTTDIAKSNQDTDSALVSTVPAPASGKSLDHALSVLLARRILYDQSSWFPVVVHRMITETCTEYGCSMMRWTECGKYFWIDQKHSMLSSVLAQYFHHNRYQSLRRQLNAYGFCKPITGEKKGYWQHPDFHRDSSFETLKSIVSVGRGNGRKNKKKKVAKRSNLSTACNPPVKKKVQIHKRSVDAPVATKSLSRIVIRRFPKDAPSNESKMQHSNEVCVSQPDDSFANKFYTGDRCFSAMTEASTEGKVTQDKASNPEVDSLRIEYQFLSDPIPDFNYNIPPFSDDSSNDALTALATVASFLPIAPTPLYTPMMKSLDVIQPVPIKQAAQSFNAVSPQEIKMTILADAASCFFPTPIKLQNLTDCIPCFTLTDSTGCCCDDAFSSYSVGSLSSPMKLVLPFCDRSAFTPVVSSTDQMVVEFCQSFN